MIPRLPLPYQLARLMQSRKAGSGRPPIWPQLTSPGERGIQRVSRSGKPLVRSDRPWSGPAPNPRSSRSILHLICNTSATSSTRALYSLLSLSRINLARSYMVSVRLLYPSLDTAPGRRPHMEWPPRPQMANSGFQE